MAEIEKEEGAHNGVEMKIRKREKRRRKGKKEGEREMGRCRRGGGGEY